MKIRAVYDMVKATFRSWSEDNASQLGAALAYYAVFSISPLVVLSIVIASLIFHDTARESVVAEIRDTVGPAAGEAVSKMIVNARDSGATVLATVLGLATLVFGASGVFTQLQEALNTIWKVKQKPGRGILAVIKDRFLSFTMVLGTGFLLLVSLVVSAGLSALDHFLTPEAVPGTIYLWRVLNWLLSLALVTLLFALIYKVLPDVKLAWRDVWVGAVVTAVLFTVGKYLIGLYLGKSGVASPYGAAGSVVIILLWVYYSSQILLLGAEFTHVYVVRQGRYVEPAENAVRAGPATEREAAPASPPRT